VTVQVWPNGTAAAVDRFSLGNEVPLADTCQDWTLVSASEANGVTTVELRRALSTGDAQDHPLGVNKQLRTKVLVAHGASDDLAYHAANVRRPVPAIGPLGSARPAGDRLMQPQQCLAQCARSRRSHMVALCSDMRCKSTSSGKRRRVWIWTRLPTIRPTITLTSPRTMSSFLWTEYASPVRVPFTPTPESARLVLGPGGAGPGRRGGLQGTLWHTGADCYDGKTTYYETCRDVRHQRYRPPAQSLCCAAPTEFSLAAPLSQK
jgi:hypothetical protein